MVLVASAQFSSQDLVLELEYNVRVGCTGAVVFTALIENITLHQAVRA